MDFSWIDEYEKDEYHDLYKSTVESVEINFLYVNKTNELFYIKTKAIQNCLFQTTLFTLSPLVH